MPSIRKQYGIASGELLEALELLPRCKAIFERSIVETHMRKLLLDRANSSISELEVIQRRSSISWLIWLSGLDQPIVAQCKIANSRKVLAADGKRNVGNFVSVHDAGDSFEFPENRLYGPDPLQIVAVCMGRVTSKWGDFLFGKTIDLERHEVFPHKLAPLHQVPDPRDNDVAPWYRDLADLLTGIEKDL